MSVNNDYQRIAKAIEYLQENIERQPQLDEVAAHIHLSAAHFQKLFSRWAGVSPKKYLQVLTVEKAKALLSNKHPVLDTAEQLGLSSSSRLYDHFVNIEALTPGEFKKCAAGLEFGYGTSLTPFGWVFIAQTNKGIHQLQFMESPEDDSHLEKLKQQWPQARFREDKNGSVEIISEIFSKIPKREALTLPLHLCGTNFQISVWKLLLNIQSGQLSTYSKLAQQLGKPQAARAVGNAVGANPVAFVIPCHRVIQKNGQLGGYRWGLTRKRVIHTWEIAK